MHPSQEIWYRLHEDRISHLDTIHKRDRHTTTDRHTTAVRHRMMRWVVNSICQLKNIIIYNIFVC